MMKITKFVVNVRTKIYLLIKRITLWK